MARIVFAQNRRNDTFYDKLRLGEVFLWTSEVKGSQRARKLNFIRDDRGGRSNVGRPHAAAVVLTHRSNLTSKCGKEFFRRLDSAHITHYGILNK